MSIDAGIYNLANRPTVPLQSFGDTMGQQLGMANAQQQNQLGAMKIQAMQDDHATQLRQQAAKLDADQRAQVQSALSDMAKAAEWVEGAGPAEAPKRWEIAKQHYPPQVAAQLGDYDPQKIALAKAQAKTWDQIMKEGQPQTDAGKLEADLKAGRINQATFDAESKKRTYIAPEKEPPADLKEALGPDGKPGFFRVAKDGTYVKVDGIRPIPPKASASGLLSGMPAGTPEDANIYAQRLLSGAESWPSNLTIRTDPTVNAGIKLARQMDPGFNSATHAQREKTFKAFTVGKEADSLNKISTALTHLSEYSDALEKVPDSTGITPLNKVLNAGRGAMGNVEINRANTIRTTLANELEGAYRAGGGTESGIEHMRELLDPNPSIAVRRANLATVTSLLQGKQSAMVDQYKRGMGKFAAPLDVLSPEANAAQEKVLARGGMGGSAPAVLDPARAAKVQALRSAGVPEADIQAALGGK